MTFLPAVLRVLAGAIVTGAVGYALVRFALPGLRRAEKVAWSFAAGLLVHATLLVVAWLLFPGSGALPILAGDAVVVAASFLARRSIPAPPPAEPEKERPALVVPLLVVAGAGCLIYLVAATSEPMWATDYLAMWGLKGKTIFETGSIPRRLFQDPALAWGRPDHPLLVPLSLAALASLSGGWHDQALALLFPLCELATILAAWGFLSRRVSPLAGASAAALVGVCFPLYRAVNSGLAEVPLAFAVVLASGAFFDVLETGSRSAITRLFVASLLAAWTKPEGTLFVLLLAGVLCVRHGFRFVHAWKRGGWALVVPPILHSGLMYFLARPLPQHDFDASFLEPRRWAELLPRFGIVLGRIVAIVGPAVWIALLAVVLFLFLTRRGLADALLAVIAVQFLAYIAAFAISSADPIWKVDSCFPRITATLLPALFLVLAARLSAPGNEGSGPARGSGREAAKEVAHAPLEIRPSGDLEERSRVG
jgi:hypothetical protein